MRKLSQKGVTKVQSVIALIVVLAIAGASAYLLLPGEKPAAEEASATVKLHDAEEINIADWAEQHVPDMPNVDINVSGAPKVTVNSFSATNVTVKLHNKDTGNWITIIEDQTINDLTTVNNLQKEITTGTYDKVSVYIGTITIDIEWDDIEITGTIDLPQGGTHDINITIPGKSFSQSVTINREFVIDLSAEVSVTAGENKVFDVDTGPPFDMPSSGSGMNLDFDMKPGDLDVARMQAKALE